MATVVVDLDDVVLDFTGTWQRLYREWFDAEPNEQAKWDDPMGYPRFGSKAEFFNWFEWIGGWDEVGYVPGAPGGLWDLLASGVVVRFVTARWGAGASAAQRWWKASIWQPRTFLHVGVENKESVKAQVYIDDKPAVVNAAVKADRHAIVFDRPWNQTGVDKRVRRAAHWRDASRLALALTRGETDAGSD